MFVSQVYDQVLPPEQNSVGIWTYEVARRLAARDHTTVIARRVQGKPARTEVDGANFLSLKCAPPGVWARASRAWRRVAPASRPLYAQRFYALEYLAQAIRLIRRLGPDIIHLQNFPLHAPALRLACPEAAIVLHMHCDWLAQLDCRAMGRGIAAADLVVGCSEHVVAAARERFAGISVPFAVLPNGAPIERIGSHRAQRDASTVVFVGRLSPEKGLHTLLEAWPKVVAARPDARLEIIGPEAETPREFLVDLSDEADVRALARFYDGGSALKGSYANALRAMVPSPLAQTVSFIPQLPQDQVLARIGRAGLLVNPSLSESFGMSLIEAIAVGTPVVATRAGGMPEIIRETGAGTIIDRNDSSALAEAVVHVLANPERHAEIACRGAERAAELYSWSRIAALTDGLHGEALAARRARSAAQSLRPDRLGFLKNV